MTTLNRFLALIFIFLMLSSLFLFSLVPMSVQAVQKPSTPQFTIKLIDDSYDAPPTTTKDPYTGTTSTIPGYHVDQRKLAVTIKNQPFTPYTDKNGQKYRLYYYVESKGHFGDEWTDFYNVYLQSNSDYTTITARQGYSELPGAGSQLDFRVQAIIGYEGFTGDPFVDRIVYEITDLVGLYGFVDVVSSGWSKVQTFTIPEHGEASPPTQNATPHPPTTTNNNNNNNNENNNQQQTTITTLNPLTLIAISILTASIIVTIIMLTHKKLANPHHH